MAFAPGCAGTDEAFDWAQQMTGTDWILLDTETSGITRPIYCVELAAQRMRGLQPVGDPFRALLDHDVEIEPMAQSIHGYSRAYLRRHGWNPREVHEDFIRFAEALPIVAFNLSFDWARVLAPEMERLGLTGNYRPGFCALTLARRCIHETAGHGLQRLRAHFFPYHRGVAHRALDDVVVTRRLLAEIIWPRLECAGLLTFTEIARFSRATPVAGCLQRLREAANPRSPAPVAPACPPTDSLSEEATLVAFLRSLVARPSLVMDEITQLRNWLAARRSLQAELAMRCRGLVEISFGENVLSGDDLGRLRGRLAALVAAVPENFTAGDSQVKVA